MWVNIGFEENWKSEFLRPVLVLKKVWSLFFTVALTSKWKDNHDFYYKFRDLELNNPKYKNSSYAILSQVKVMDKKRFFENIWNVSKNDFVEIKKKLKQILF
jgi:endo-1,4-beta-D-glucanase Y